MINYAGESQSKHFSNKINVLENLFKKKSERLERRRKS